MIKRRIDIKGLSDRQAIELLLNEINLLREDLNSALSKIDGNSVILDSGVTIQEYVRGKR